MRTRNRYSTEIEAMELLRAIRGIIKMYGVVTVADVYDLEELDNPMLDNIGSYSDTKRGWVNLVAGKVVYDNGWYVELPKPILIE